MSAQSRETWKIPKSYDLGIPPFYHDILKGSDYVNLFIKEKIAEWDAQFSKFYTSNKNISNTKFEDRPKFSYGGVGAILQALDLPEALYNQLMHYIEHLATKKESPVDFLRVKEFFSYCGIDGLYDKESHTHFLVPRRLARLPSTLVRSKWIGSEDQEDQRLLIATLMDVNKEMRRYDSEISELTPYVMEAQKEAILHLLEQNGVAPSAEEANKLAFERYPDALPYHLKQQDLMALRLQAENDAKNKWAPLDPDFRYPSVGSRFDLDWDVEQMRSMRSPHEYRERYEKHYADLGISPEHEDFVPFDFHAMRARSYAIYEWVLRDFYMSKVNTGVHGDSRRYDIPRHFVNSIRRELSDNLLSICKPPHRIEPLNDGSGNYQMIVNNANAEILSLSLIDELADSFVGVPDPDPSSRPGGLAIVPKPNITGVIHSMSSTQEYNTNIGQHVSDEPRQEAQYETEAKDFLVRLLDKGLDKKDSTIEDEETAKMVRGLLSRHELMTLKGSRFLDEETESHFRSLYNIFEATQRMTDPNVQQVNLPSNTEHEVQDQKIRDKAKEAIKGAREFKSGNEDRLYDRPRTQEGLGFAHSPAPMQGFGGSKGGGFGINILSGLGKGGESPAKNQAELDSSSLGSLSDELRSLTGKLKDPAGMPPEKILSEWDRLGETMNTLSERAEKIKEPVSEAEALKLKDAAKDAKNAIDESSPLINDKSKEKGALGEAARKARLLAEQASKAIFRLLERLIQMIMGKGKAGPKDRMEPSL